MRPSCAQLACALLVAVVASDISGQSAATNRLPERFERYLATVIKPSAAERRRLLAGEPLVTLMDSDPSKEVAVFGAVWIAASPARYVELVNDIETLERGNNYRFTTKVSTPARLEDFASLDLSSDEIDDLEDCRVGRCELKLGEESIEAIRSRVDFTAPSAEAQAEALFRERMLEYVNRYREKGNAGLAAYRDGSRPVYVATEFEALLGGMPALSDWLPDLRRYLLNYPAATLPNSTAFIYWQEARFGLKPTIRINHLVTYATASETIVASKMLYASHYFWTALELRVLVPDPARANGFWFITVNRSRADGLSGILGRMIRGRVRRSVQNGVLAGLQATRTRLERRSAP